METEHPMTESSVTDYRPEQGEQAVRQMPGDAAKNDAVLHPAHGEGSDGGNSKGADVTRSPEEESQSQIPGDPRPPHQTQPPTKEQY